MLVRVRDGDIAAFGAFYDSEGAGLLRWFVARTAATDVAADLTAETFACALESVHRYVSIEGHGPVAWLYGIAHNEWRHWVRRERVSDQARQRLGIHVPVPAVDDFDLVELRADVERIAGPLNAAMERLSDPVRRAVCLRVVDELPYSVVAEQLGCSEGAARVRVARGLAALVGELGEAWE